NVTVSNLVATEAQWPCTVAGIPGHTIDGVTFNNFRIRYQGSSARESGLVEVPEHISKYPSADMFGVLPAYGIYCRHAQDLRLANLDLKVAGPDLRSAVVCEDVSNLVLDSLSASRANAAVPVLFFHQVRESVIRGCRPQQEVDVFLKVSGAESKAIRLIGNDFGNAHKPFSLGLDVPAASVVEVANGR